jgi:hypothetical protein
MILLSKIIKKWLTENDGESFCPARAFGIAAGLVMIYKFAIATGTPEYLAFAGGISAIGASMAVNKYSEKRGAQNDKPADGA